MIERQQTHPVGTFPPCTTCGQEPRHFIGAGRSQHEPINVLKPAGQTHLLRCRCGLLVAHKQFAVAAREWTARNPWPVGAQPPAPVRNLSHLKRP